MSPGGTLSPPAQSQADNVEEVCHHCEDRPAKLAENECVMPDSATETPDTRPLIADNERSSSRIEYISVTCPYRDIGDEISA